MINNLFETLLFYKRKFNLLQTTSSMVSLVLFIWKRCFPQTGTENVVSIISQEEHFK